MGIAEKYYRKQNKIPTDRKLTNPEWHEVNSLHHFLSFCKSEECRIRIIEAGAMVASKERLVANLKLQKMFLKYLDKVMCDRSISLEEKGKRIAKYYNELSFTIQTIEAYDLKIPIDKLTIE